jgi:hypothetical protein
LRVVTSVADGIGPPVSCESGSHADPLLTYFFYRSFHDVASDLDRLLLAHAQDAANGLALDRRVPLRLEDVNVVGDLKIVQSADT